MGILLPEPEPATATVMNYKMSIRGALRDIAIKKREINNTKIKLIPFVIYF